MSVEAPTTQSTITSRLAETPSVLRNLTAAHAAAHEALEPRLYDLCRLRVAMLLHNSQELASDVVSAHDLAQLPLWPNAPEFSDTERACLAFTEQFVIDVASMSDDLARTVVDHLGANGFSDFVHALLVIEQRQRLCLIWGRLFKEPRP